MKNIKRIAALMLCLVMVMASVCTGAVFAQTTYEVSGTFLTQGKQSGAPVNPASVTFYETGGKIYRAQVTENGQSGVYSVQVPHGIYDIVIKKQGYLDYTINNVRVHSRDISFDDLETALLPGDLNGDGKINTKDLAVMMRAMNPEPVFESARAVADIDEDGVVQVADLAIIKPNFEITSESYDWTNVMKLQTDYRYNPMGIDYETPEFNWVMESTKRGQKQTAYELGVATSYDKAVSGDFDVWFSGKVESNSTHAYYGVVNGDGAVDALVLEPATEYYWTVVSYGMDGEAIPSPEVAKFETGLFGDFGVDNKWVAANDPYYAFDNATIDLELTVTGTAFGVNFGVSEDNSERYMWQISLTAHDTPCLRYHYNKDDSWKVIKSVDISHIISDGAAWVNKPIAIKLVMGEENISTYIEGVHVLDYPYQGDNRYVGKLYGHTSGSETGVFKNVVISDADGNVLVDGIQETTLASSLFRKQFALEKDASLIEKARLYSTAAGNQIMYINGKRASDDYMAPGKSQFTTTLYYQTYDVKELLVNGDNTVAAEVGHGWYNAGAVGTNYGTNVGLKAKLVITYTDGSTQVIDTDSTWLGTTDGPTTTDRYYIGQHVDARRKIEKWNENGSESYKWTAVTASDTFKPNNSGLIATNLVGENMEPVRNTMVLHPTSVTNPKENVFVYKFDQNLVGTSRITAEAPEGTEIVISYCEFLSGDGGTTIDPTAYLGHNGEDRYIFRGDEGGETVEFDLVYHGYQYLQITGLPEALPFENVEGLVLTSDMEETGVIETSNSKINRYIDNVRWSIRGNFVSTLTDCPTREKNTWTGDAQIFAAVASYYSNVFNHYRNFQDMTRASRYPDGAVSEIIPSMGPITSGSGVNTKTPSGWSDCLIVIPWEMYNQYGDVTIIKENYETMKAWIDFLLTKKVHSTDEGVVLPDAEIPEYIIDPKYVRLDGNYGDHLAHYNNKSDKGYYVNEYRTTSWVWRETSYAEVGTAFSAYSCYILAEMADEIGETEDAAYYRELHQKFSAAWKKNFVKEDGITCRSGGYTDSDGVYHDGEGSQTSYAMGLYFNMYTDEEKPLAAAKLAEIVAKENYIQTVGFIGMNLLYPALGENGQYDTAMKLMENESYPSLLNMVNNGATTIWETYGGGVMSRNHYVFGAPARWLYTDVLGIAHAYKDGNEGFAHFELRPQYASYDDTSVTWAKGSFDSTNGLIKSDWKVSDDRSTFTYNCTVPANTSATLILPVENDSAYITEGGKDIALSEGVEYIKTENGRRYYEITSGVYEFVVHNDITA